MHADMVDDSRSGARKACTLVIFYSYNIFAFTFESKKL